MFRTKFIISISVFVTFLIVTSVIKNKTRVTEKQILNLKKIILIKEKNLNEAELDFYYLTSPEELEKKLNLIDLIIMSQLNIQIYISIFLIFLKYKIKFQLK